MEKGNLTLIYNNLQRFKCFLTNLQNISLDLSKTFKNSTIVTFFIRRLISFIQLHTLLYYYIAISSSLPIRQIDRTFRGSPSRFSNPFTKLRKRYYKERKIEPVTFSKERKRRKFLARASTEEKNKREDGCSGARVTRRVFSCALLCRKGSREGDEVERRSVRKRRDTRMRLEKKQRYNPLSLFLVAIQFLRSSPRET